jgi:hypothetical protein
MVQVIVPPTLVTDPVEAEIPLVRNKAGRQHHDGRDIHGLGRPAVGDFHAESHVAADQGPDSGFQTRLMPTSALGGLTRLMLVTMLLELGSGSKASAVTMLVM